MRVDRIVRVDDAPTTQRDAASVRSRPPSGSSALPRERLASGPGLVAAAFGLDTGWTGLDLCDPASPLRLEAAPAGRAAARGDRHAADRHRLRRRAVDRRGRGASSSAATRRSRARPPGADRPTAMDQRSIEPARVPGHPRAPGGRDLVRAVAPAGRGARAVERPGRRRARPRRDRPGAGPARGATRASGSAPRTTSGRRSSARRAAAASSRPSSSRSRRRSTRRRAWRRCSPTSGGRSCATSGASCTRCPRCARRSRAASTRSASCSTRRRRGSAACGRRSASPTTGCGGGSTRSSGRSSGSALQEPIVTLRNGRYVVPVKAEARSRVKGIVHDASGSGQTLFIEPLVAVELGNAWREAQVAEAEEIARILDELSALVAANADALRETLDALARFDFWAAKASLAAEMDASRAETTERTEAILLSARHPGPDRPGRPDRHPARRRLHGARRDRPEHRRQDRHAADARPAQPDAPGRAPRPGRARQPAAGLARRLRRHRRRAVDRPVAVDVLRPPALDHPDRRGGRAGHARPARRAGRRDRPDRGLGAGPGAPRPLHPGRRARRGDDPLRRAQGLRPHDARGAQRRGRVRPRDAVADLPADDRAARRQPGVRHRRAARAARSRSSPTPGRACPRRSGRSRRPWPRSRRPRARPARRSTARGPPSCARPRRCAPPRRSGAARGGSATRPSGPPASRRSGSSTTCAPRSGPAARRSSARPSPARPSTRRSPGPRRARPAPGRRRDGRGRRRARTSSDAGGSASGRGAVSGGWEGRIAALERGGRRATLEAGGMRVTVDVDDLVPAIGGDEEPDRGANGAGRSAPNTNAAELRVDRARSRRVIARPARRAGRRGARGARPLPRRRRPGRARQGPDHPRHGDRRAARRGPGDGGSHPLVKSMRPGERGEGGDGATIVEF